MKIGIMIAMEKEFKLFATQIQNLQTQTIAGQIFHTGCWNQHELILAISGMGKVNSAVCATHLISDFKADLIINIGISGGLDSALQIGDFVVGRDIVYHDVWFGEPYPIGQVQNLPLFYHSDTALTDKFTDLKQGLLCCGDQFITAANALQKIKENFPTALAVDMESAAIAQTCHLHNTPFLCIRQISDTPGVEHHAEQYATFWQNAPANSVKMLIKILQCL